MKKRLVLGIAVGACLTTAVPSGHSATLALFTTGHGTMYALANCPANCTNSTRTITLSIVDGNGVVFDQAPGSLVANPYKVNCYRAFKAGWGNNVFIRFANTSVLWISDHNMGTDYAAAVTPRDSSGGICDSGLVGDEAVDLKSSGNTFVVRGGHFVTESLSRQP